MWGQIVMRDLVGGPIPSAKLNQATASAVAACDAADGVADGVIDDPRTCKFSAKANVCGDADGAGGQLPDACRKRMAIDRIWDGPRNARGNKVWFGLDRGTSIGALNGTTPFALGVTQFHWDEHDRNFDWKTVSADEYADVAQDGSRNIADVTDTFGDLDTFRRSGGKLLTLVGANDQLIMPRGVINYYREMATRYGKHDRPDFEQLQKFYRLFRVPGAGHCGVPNAFPALVNWVENGVAPEQIINRADGGPRTRPLCPYPQKAIYNGIGQHQRRGQLLLRRQSREATASCARTSHEVQARGEGTPGLLGYRRQPQCLRGPALARRSPPSPQGVGPLTAGQTRPDRDAPGEPGRLFFRIRE